MQNYKSLIYASYRTAFKGEVNADTQRFGAEKLKPVVQHWVQKLAPSSVICDLGCGAGELLLAFRQLGFEKLIGCDVSSEQTENIRETFEGVETADCFEFLQKLPSESIDVVTMFDILEHLGPQLAFELMQEVRRVLVPRGRIIVHMPNGISPLVGAVFWGDITHEWCLTPQSALTFCKVSGFDNFECVEHLGESSSIRGAIRKVCWKLTKYCFRLLNRIETGHAGTNIWTRNFAFSALKKASDR